MAGSARAGEVGRKPVRIAAMLACTFLFLAGGAGRGGAAEPGVTVTLRPGLDQTHVETVLGAAQRAGQPVTVRWDDAARSGQSVSPAAPRLDAWQTFEAGLIRTIEGLAEIGAIPRAIAAAWRASDEHAAGLRLLVLLAGALLAAGTARLLCARAGRPAAGADRWQVAGRRLLDDGVTLAVFALSASLLLRLLPSEAGFSRSLGVHLVRSGAVAALFLIAGRCLLSPGDPANRLLPLPRPHWHMAMLAAYALLGLAIDVAASLARHVGVPPEALDAWMLLGASLVTILKMMWVWLGRRDITTLFRDGAGGDAGPLRRSVAAALPFGLAAVVAAAWAIAVIAGADPGYRDWSAAIGATQIAAIAVPLLALAGDVAVRRLSARHGAEGSPLTRAAAGGGRALITGGIWVAGLAAVVRAWQPVATDPGLRQVGASAVEIGGALVVGCSLWWFLRGYFEAQLPAGRSHQPSEDGEGPTIQSRLSTVLPIVRDLAFGTITAVTCLIVLSALGIDIGPLLAGFGVVGLALSFGSQALVRDIVSGIFFMADDAFRIGEYIDTGKLMGTVERISLRSVQLRHQNGPVHTVPFGTVSQITNFSRDWATGKFLIRLDHSADLDKARRVIKRVGQEMMDDADLGPEFLLPLKMQGVHEIADTALVVRCKFTVRPTRPSFIQREALKRVYRALQQAGVPLALTSAIRAGFGDTEEAVGGVAPHAPPHPAAAAPPEKAGPEQAAGASAHAPAAA
ncbi:MAG: mechanosensitive ion channel family protein [Methylobacterium frigidaeris]